MTTCRCSLRASAAFCQRVNNNVTCASDWLPGLPGLAGLRLLPFGAVLASSANTNVPFQHELDMCSLSWKICMRRQNLVSQEMRR